MNLSFPRSRRLQYLFGTVVWTWFLFILFRIVFFFTFSNSAGDVSSSDINRAFWMGIRFDLRLSILISLPLLILAMVPIINLGRSFRTRLFGKWIYGIGIVSSIIFFAADLGYYAYLQQRVDIIALSLLENPAISTLMLWESYPVVWLALLLCMICILWIKVHNKILVLTIAKQQKFHKFSHKMVGVFLGGLIYLFSIWGTFAQYALLWSDAFFSRNPFVSALALNPVLYFYDTTTFSEANYDEEKVREFYPLMADWLGVDEPNIENLNFIRHVKSRKTYSKPPNVIIIFLESVALNRMGLVGNSFNPTPTLDRLANDGLFFTKFYVPWVSTSRSVFTMLTGIPDVARNKTSSRNPLIRDQYSIISQFDNHDKYYMLGGSASWANIRSLISNNLRDIQIFEQDDFNRPRVDVWGISDLDLIREAHNLFSKRDNAKPFFAVIQTAGNHRPYSIPDDNAGFVIKDDDEKALRKAGFKSVKQYNAMRFLDHIVGQFFELAEDADYFDNTIFVLFGDHGNADPKATHMQADDYALRLRSYNVPLIIYAPGLELQSKQIETVSGLADLMPTIASLSGIEYINRTLGRDILSVENDYAFIVNKKISPSSFGVLNSENYIRIFRDGSGMEYHNLMDDNPEYDIKDDHPEDVQIFKKMTDGIYETAKYMLHHNKK